MDSISKKSTYITHTLMNGQWKMYLSIFRLSLVVCVIQWFWRRIRLWRVSLSIVQNGLERKIACCFNILIISVELCFIRPCCSPGDCWFIAATASLAVSNAKLIERVIPADQSFNTNYAGVSRHQTEHNTRVVKYNVTSRRRCCKTQYTTVWRFYNGI